MRRLLLVTVLTMCWASEGLAKGIGEDHIEFGPFGPLTVYSRSTQPSHVVLFVSGDGGWNLGVIEMARELAALDAGGGPRCLDSLMGALSSESLGY
jgi:hypothetical protein